MPRRLQVFARLIACTAAAACLAAAHAGADSLKLVLRGLVPADPATNTWRSVERAVEWNAGATAVVTCDMWDQHWCKGATARVAEMAPRMNQTVAELRKRGALIIHCPSDTMKFYEGTPARKLAQSAPKAEPKSPLRGWRGLDLSREAALPIDDSDGGCDDTPQCKQGSPWRRQIASLEIADGDAVTDSVEAYNLIRHRGITNVMVMGVHQNMCVLGRPFAIRQLVSQGLNVVLMRDLTDSMYNPRSRPHVDHFTGNDLITWHIEKYWCPTVTSDQVLGGNAFRFAADSTPPRTYRGSEHRPRSRRAGRVKEKPTPGFRTGHRQGARCGMNREYISRCRTASAPQQGPTAAPADCLVREKSLRNPLAPAPT